MSVLLRAAVCAAGLLLIVMAIRSIIVREMTERQSLFWIFSGGVIAVFGLWPAASQLVADLFGVQYTPSIVFAIAIVMAVYGIFSCFRYIAGLHRQMQELALQVSLLRHENDILFQACSDAQIPLPVHLDSDHENVCIRP